MLQLFNAGFSRYISRFWQHRDCWCLFNGDWFSAIYNSASVWWPGVCGTAVLQRCDFRYTRAPSRWVLCMDEINTHLSIWTTPPRGAVDIRALGGKLFLHFADCAKPTSCFRNLHHDDGQQSVEKDVSFSRLLKRGVFFSLE